MRSEMVIGITAQIGESEFGFSYGVRAAYIDFLAREGMRALVIPPVVDKTTLEGYLALCDGLVLTGGEDISPALVRTTKAALAAGEDIANAWRAAADELEATSKLGANEIATAEEILKRDCAETTLLALALERGLPILGICRGIQLINLFYGGTVGPVSTANATSPVSHWPSNNPHQTAHEVEFADGTLFGQSFTDSERQVNSLHKLAAQELGADLEAVAWAPDGSIEVLYNPAQMFLWGFQWHPEHFAAEKLDGAIAAAFATACRTRS